MYQLTAGKVFLLFFYIYFVFNFIFFLKYSRYLILKTHLIPLETLLAALQMMKIEDIDIDETQCIVANLIYEGKIKGYISHQHKKLVVSKQNPFPPLTSIE